MRIEGVNNGSAMQTGMSQSTDATTKNLQNQIALKQQELQKLSENEDMSMETKMKKRQEINQEIADLNRQLRQHEIQQRKEKQQKQDDSMKDMLGEQDKQAESETESKTGSGFSSTGMRAMIAADASMKMSDVQGSVVASLDRKVAVLEAEISQDAGRGVSTQKKEEEVAELRERALKAAEGQMNNLKDAGKAVREARIEENEKKQAKKTASSDTFKAGAANSSTVIYKDKDASVSLSNTGNMANIKDNGINIVI